MAQPQWSTPSGNLGTIPEGIFYQIPLDAEDPDGETVYFKLIAGQLPDGIQVKPNGIIEGTPKSVINVQGVPTEVTEDITTKFAIRAYTTRTIGSQTIIDRVNDRTFTITVTGQDIPEFVTPAGQIAQCYDGTEVNLQIEFTDQDLTDQIRINILSGQLPPGLVLNSITGVISGVILPITGVPDTAGAGFSNSTYDQYPYDFATRSASKSFPFTLEITDGKDSNIRSFSIYVWSRDSMSADTTDVTADNTFVTADVTPTRTPLLLTPEGDLGRVRADNFYAFKFDGIDFDGDPITYELSVGEGIGFDADGTGYSEDGVGFDRGNFSLPPFTNGGFYENTGWLAGYLADIGATEQTFRFAIRVKKTNNPSIISPFYYFTLTVIGNVETEVIWLTKPDLGVINNGAVSTLSVEAVNVGGRPLEYRLAPGTNSKLPQGLTLLPSGHIAGKVSFNTFALDGGATTFDIDLNTRLDIDATTFDMKCTFTVNAYSPQTEDPGYQLSEIVVNNGGSNYGVVNVTFSPPASGITATGLVTLTNGVVDSVTITNPGSGYISAPIVTFDLPPSGGVQAQASAVLNGDRVSSVIITTPGQGYAYPTITIASPPSSINAIQATAGYVTVTNGVITSVEIGNPGRGYLSPPAVIITGTGGSGAVISTVIEIINVVNAVSTFRTFTVMVNRAFNTPYEKLYIKAMPPLADRALIDQLVGNQDIFPINSVYRRDDPNFGVSKGVVYDHAYGLAPAALDAYAESLDINHYWKNLILGEIKTAQALDANGQVLYEVLYSQIIDDQVNDQGESVGKSVTLPYPVVDDQGETIDVVYPNSLINMRDQVISEIGQISPALPAWMTSKQVDGRVLGFVPAWVIAYVKPGESGRILYYINEIFGEQLNKVDFKADRYELDRSQTYNWNPVTDSWIPTPAAATIFDQNTTIFDEGSTRFIAPADQYGVGDRFDKYLLYPRTNILG